MWGHVCVCACTCTSGNVIQLAQGSELAQDWFPILALMLDSYVTLDMSSYFAYLTSLPHLQNRDNTYFIMLL